MSPDDIGLAARNEKNDNNQNNARVLQQSVFGPCRFALPVACGVCSVFGNGINHIFRNCVCIL